MPLAKLKPPIAADVGLDLAADVLDGHGALNPGAGVLTPSTEDMLDRFAQVHVTRQPKLPTASRFIVQ